MAGQPAFASQGPPTPPWAPTNNPLLATEPNLIVLASSTKVTANFPVTLGPFLISTEQFKGVLIFINVTAFSGTSFTAQMQDVDFLSGAAVNMPGVVTGAINATGSTTLLLYPGAQNGAFGATVAVSGQIPDHWQLVLAGTVTSVTLSISALYLR